VWLSFYRFEVKVLSRGAKRSAVAASAYRSGEELTDNASGRVFNYETRHGVLYAAMLYPDGDGPSRGDFWNTVEDHERRRDAQLLREFIGAFPHELSTAQMTAAAHAFVRDYVTPHGLVADVTIHGPDRRGDLRNYHTHILTSLRSYHAGTFGPKAELRHLNERSQIHVWRNGWERTINDALDRARIPSRVTARARAGVAPPEPKQGPFATDLERRGRRTFAGDDRRRARDVRERAERRDREKRREREHAPDRPLGKRVEDALARFSLLVASAAAAAPVTLEHPARDRWHEFRGAVESDAFAQHIARLRADGWIVERRERSVVARRGESAIETDGGRVRVHGKLDTAAIDAALDALQARGWSTMRIKSGGTDQEKAAIMMRALDRGLTVSAEPKDRELLDTVRKHHDRERNLRGVAAKTRAAAPRDAGERDRGAEESVAPSGAAGSDPNIAVEEAFRLITQQQAIFSTNDLMRTFAKLTGNEEQTAALMVAARQHHELLEIDPDERGHQRFTTQTVFALESRFMEDALAKAKRRIDVPEATLAEIRAQIKAEHPTLSPGQAAAFDVCTSGRCLIELRGIAGGGKSYLMGLVNDFFERVGMSVHGDALAGVAADGLAKEAGIEDSRTTAQWKVYFEKNGPIPNSVHIGDEKGMAGTGDAAALLDKFNVTILVGDALQLQPIAAGAPFRSLWDRLPAENRAELAEPRRQSVAWQAEATKLFYDGRTRDALKLYHDNDRWVESATRDEAKEKIVAAWTAAAEEHPERSRLVLAYTRADVLDLNMRLRAVRREKGELTGNDVTFETADGERQFAVNERVLFREPKKMHVSGLGERPIRNGTPAVITAIDEVTNSITVRVPEYDNRTVKVNFDDYKAIDYADCGTTHTAQGKTVGEAWALATAHRGVGSDLTYVMMSRHKQDAHLYWSRDQFKNEAAVYRSLTRFNPKDTSIDYSRTAHEMGLGLPNQPAGALAARSPRLIRDELLAVVRTADHLRANAPEPSRPAAEAAYKEVRAWYYRVDRQLRDLEAREIRAVPIEGRAAGFTERLALLERSVGTAVDRARDRERGTVADRLADLRADVAAIRRDVDARRDRAQADLGASPPDLLPAPATVVAGELERLTRAVAAARETLDEHRALAALDAAAQGRGAEADAARNRADDLRATIADRLGAAQRDLATAQARYADAGVLRAMQTAYDARLTEHRDVQERREVAAMMLPEYERQSDVAVLLDAQLDAIEHGATHADLDRIANDIAAQRNAARENEHGADIGADRSDG
jgi:ATP-dependent exoDNAse (exonuclease V) alpha subunit